MNVDETVVALLREREGYVRRDRKDRIKAVDAELKALGHKPARARRTSTEEPSTVDLSKHAQEPASGRETAVRIPPEVPSTDDLGEPETAVASAPETRQG